MELESAHLSKTANWIMIPNALCSYVLSTFSCVYDIESKVLRKFFWKIHLRLCDLRRKSAKQPVAGFHLIINLPRISRAEVVARYAKQSRYCREWLKNRCHSVRGTQGTSDYGINIHLRMNLDVSRAIDIIRFTFGDTPFSVHCAFLILVWNILKTVRRSIRL